MSTTQINPIILEGRLIDLTPVLSEDRAELHNLDRQCELLPQMEGVSQRNSDLQSFLPTMLIKTKAKKVVGVIACTEHPEFDKVGIVSLYINIEKSRPGASLEAIFLYFDAMFRYGFEHIHCEVLEFNWDMLRILAKGYIKPVACLRKHSYIAGQFWNVYIFVFDKQMWESIKKLPLNNFWKSLSENRRGFVK